MERSNKAFKASIQPHWHTIHPFSPLQQPYKNVHDGSYGFCVPRWSRWHIVILFVDNSWVKIYLKKQEDLKRGKKLITSDLLQIIKGQKRLVKYKQKVCKKMPWMRSYIRLQKNNTRDSNVVPHRSTSLARQCLTSLSRREAVLSLWYGRSCWFSCILTFIKLLIKRYRLLMRWRTLEVARKIKCGCLDGHQTDWLIVE